MRTGIPISARLFALAAMAFSPAGKNDKVIQQAARNVNSKRYFHSAGTEQRKRRKINRMKINNRRK
jgi:hypothetical protein